MDYEYRIQQLGWELPSLSAPAGAYRPVVISGPHAFISGQISRSPDGKVLTGIVGDSLTLEQGKQAARMAALTILAWIRREIGWSRFGRLAKLTGYIQCAPGFYDLPKVLDGASEVFLEFFNEFGIHARAVLGTASLPLNAAVEIEAVVELQ